MGIARKGQKLQDWLTQQWVILTGRKIQEDSDDWLLGPFGNTDGIGVKFVQELAEKEGLTLEKSNHRKGLIRSIHQLQLSSEELSLLAPEVIEFYENTGNYEFDLTVKWNPLFKPGGFLVKLFFSKRLDQLNVPLRSEKDSSALTSEIIQLTDPQTAEVKRTIWLRTFVKTGKVVYSGVYGTCLNKSGRACIKAIFPLPNGNATVILSPSVGAHGELILKSAGKKFGDSGFYFLLNDSKGQLWAKFIRSFRDTLTVSSNGRDYIIAVQKLTLWKLNVMTFEYSIRKKKVM